MQGGLGACSPEKNDKNGAIWCILSVPKNVIMNLKINNFKDNKSTTTKSICQKYLDVHFCTKVNIFTFNKGGLWVQNPKISF